MSEHAKDQVFSDTARAVCDLLDQKVAEEYCRASHARADALEVSIPPAARTLPALLE